MTELPAAGAGCFLGLLRLEGLALAATLLGELGLAACVLGLRLRVGTGTGLGSVGNADLGTNGLNGLVVTRYTARAQHCLTPADDLEFLIANGLFL